MGAKLAETTTLGAVLGTEAFVCSFVADWRAARRELARALAAQAAWRMAAALEAEEDEAEPVARVHPGREASLRQRAELEARLCQQLDGR